MRSSLLLSAALIAAPAPLVALADGDTPQVPSTAPDTRLKTPASELAVSPQKLAVAKQLVELLHPNDEIFQANMQGWEAALRAVMGRDPTLMKLEAEFPGVVEAGIAAGRPIATEILRSLSDQSKLMKIEIVASRMSLDELQDAKAFIGSPVGQRFMQRAKASVDVGKFNSELAERSLSTGSDFVTVQDTDKLARNAVRGAVAETSGADLLAIMKFEQSSASQRLQEASREADQKLIAIANSPDPKLVAKQNKAITAALIAFAEGKGRPGTK